MDMIRNKIMELCRRGGMAKRGLALMLAVTLAVGMVPSSTLAVEQQRESIAVEVTAEADQDTAVPGETDSADLARSGESGEAAEDPAADEVSSGEDFVGAQNGAASEAADTAEKTTAAGTDTDDAAAETAAKTDEQPASTAAEKTDEQPASTALESDDLPASREGETVTVRLDLNWIDNGNDESTRPGGEEYLAALKVQVYDESGNPLRVEDLPANVRYIQEGTGSSGARVECDLPAADQEGAALSYEILQDSEYLRTRLGYLPDTDHSGHGEIFNIQATAVQVYVKALDGAKTQNGNHRDIWGSLLTGSSPVQLTRDGAPYALTYAPTWGSFNAATGIGILTCAYLPKYTLNSHEYEYGVALPPGSSGVAQETICGKTGPYLTRSGDKYLIEYDNTVVPNHGTDIIRCYDGGTIKLTLRGADRYNATKYWLDDGRYENRPKLIFRLWRFTDKLNGSTGYRTASPVYDAGGQQYQITVPAATPATEVPLSIADELEKYDAEGYPYVYFLQETMEDSGTGAAYEQIHTGVRMVNGVPAALVPETLPAGVTRDATDESIYNHGSVANRIVETTRPSIRKRWVADAYIDDLEAIEVAMTLQYRKAGETDWSEYKTVTQGGFCNTITEQTFEEEVPKNDELGRGIEYRWVESAVLENGTALTMDSAGRFFTSHNIRNSYAADPYYETFCNWDGTHEFLRTDYERFTSVDGGDVIENRLSGENDYIIHKIWHDAQGNDISAEKRGTMVSFTLCGSDGSRRTITLDGYVDLAPVSYGRGYGLEEQSWMAHFTDLPKYTETGAPITYYCMEHGHPEALIQHDAERRYDVIVNGPGRGLVIPVTKIWIDNGDDACRYPSYVQLLYTAPGGETVEVPVGLTALSKDNSWFAQIGVPSQFLGAAAGEPGYDANKWNRENYSIREVSLNRNYMVEASNQYGDLTARGGTVTTDHHMYVVQYGRTSGEEGFMLSVTNRRVGTVDVKAVKEWRDVGADPDERPEATFVLKVAEGDAVLEPSPRADADGRVIVEGVKTVSLPTIVTVRRDTASGQAGRTEYTFTGLPKYDSLGAPITYDVEEVWDPAADLGDYRLLDITRTYTPEYIPAKPLGIAPGTGSEEEHDLHLVEVVNGRSATENIVFYKEWHDAYAANNGKRPDIYVDLYRSNQVPEAELKGDAAFTGTSVVPQAVGYRKKDWLTDDRPGRGDSRRQWKVIFEAQPRYDDEGRRITYYASESVNGSVKQFDYLDTAYKDGSLQETTADSDGYWVESSGRTPVLMETGTFVNTIGASVKLIGKKYWMNIPTGHIGELPTIDVEVWRYLGNEAPVPVTGDDGAVLKLTNLSPEAGERTIRFSFYHEEGLASSSNHLDCVLPKYNEDGELYTYTLVETINDQGNRSGGEIRLTKLYDGEVSANWVISNVYDSPVGSIQVKKLWEGREDLADAGLALSYPGTTFVLHQVYMDSSNRRTEEAWASVSVTAAEWKATSGTKTVTFDRVPIYAPDGFKYIYYVTENAIDGYSTSLMSVTSDGDHIMASQADLAAKKAFMLGSITEANPEIRPVVTFKNTYQETPVTLTGSKKFNDQGGVYGTRPYDSYTDGSYTGPDFAALGLKLYRYADSQAGQNNAIAAQEVSLTPAQWNWTDLTAASDVSGDPDKWTYRVEDLPRWAPNGTQWRYYVTENMAEPYKTLYIANNVRQNASFSTDHYVTAELINSLRSKAKFTKTWEAETWSQHPTVKAELQYRLQGETDWKRCSATAPFLNSTGKAYTVTLRETAVGTTASGQITGLPAMVRDGSTWKNVEYRFVETVINSVNLFTNAADSVLVADDGSDYQSRICEAAKGPGKYLPVSLSVAAGTGDILTNTTVRNEMTNYVSLLVKKAWSNDEDYQSFTRPAEIVFTVQRRTGNGQWTDMKDNNNSVCKVTVKASEQWEKTVTALPMYDNAGSVYEYRAVETTLPNYAAQLADSEYDEENLQFTSQTTNTLNAVEVEGRKVWDIPDRTYDLEDTEEMVQLTLYRATATQTTPVAVTYGGNDGQPTWYEEEGQFCFRYEGLPEKAPNGETYIYTVKETAIPGFAASYTNRTTVTNRVTALTLDKVNNTTGVKIYDDDLELTVKSAGGTVLAKWTRGAEEAYGSFTLTQGLTGQYANAYLGGTHGNDVLYGLPVGSYIISETGVPADYKKAADKTVQVTNSTLASAPLRAVVRDVPRESVIILKKFNDLTGGTLTDGVFKVTKLEDASYSKTMTSEGGSYRLTGLTPGHYTVTETTAPAGFASDEEQLFQCTFVLTDADKNQTFNLTPDCTTSGGSVELESGSWYSDLGAANIPRYLGLDKVADDSRLNHDDLELTVSRGGAMVFTWKRNARGTVTVTTRTPAGEYANMYVGTDHRVYGLPAGDYVITETGDIPGYAWARPATVHMAEDGSLTLTTAGDGELDEDTCVITMENHPAMGKAALRKNVTGSTTASRDITFDLYRQTGEEPDLEADEVILTGETTGEDGLWSTDECEETEDGLPVGSYYFLETEASSQTVRNPEVYPFTITKNHDRTNGTIPQGVTVDLWNDAFAAEVQWWKTDYYEETDAENLLQADFTLLDPAGEEVTVTYDADLGYRAELTRKGTYTLTETEPPAGYPDCEINQFTLQFTLADDDQESTLTLEEGAATSVGPAELLQGTWNQDGGAVGNRLSVGDLEFTKLTLPRESCSPLAGESVPLAGAEFTLYTDEDGSEVAVTYDGSDAMAVSDSDGLVQVKELLPGTYYMKETLIPVGMDPEYNGDDALWKVVVSGADDSAISDVVLYEPADPREEEEEDLEASTEGTEGDTAESSETQGETPGESEGADGETTRGRAITSVINDRYRTDIRMKKVSETDPTKPLPDSRYGLYDENGEQIATALTDEEGILVFEGVFLNTTYTIRELEAPEGSLLSANPVTIEFIATEEHGIQAVLNAEDGVATVAEDGTVIWEEPQTNVRIDKVNERGRLLAGAVLHIEDAYGNIVVEPFTSSSLQGLTLESVLTAGKTYYLWEDEAPIGYEIQPDPLAFTVNEAPRGHQENYQQVVRLVNSLPEGEDLDGGDDAGDSNRNKNKNKNKGNGSGDDDGDGNTPATGDSSNLLMWFRLLLLSAAAALLLFTDEKKRNSGE